MDYMTLKGASRLIYQSAEKTSDSWRKKHD